MFIQPENTFEHIKKEFKYLAIGLPCLYVLGVKVAESVEH